MNPQAVDLPLRGLHLPAPVSWWPPAIGWWLLLGLIILLGLVVYLWRRYLVRRRLYRSALDQLAALTSDYRTGQDDHRLAVELSVLLRRLSLSLYPRQQVASLTGDSWLIFLDRAGGMADSSSGFYSGPGRALVDAPYNPQLTVDGDALLSLCRQWIEATTPGRVAI